MFYYHPINQLLEQCAITKRPQFIKDFSFGIEIGSVAPKHTPTDIEIRKEKKLCQDTNADPLNREKCGKCFVTHFPHPNTRDCKLSKKRQQQPFWEYRLRGGAKEADDEVSFEHSLQNFEESVNPMVNRAISCAKSHGINVHRGVANLANGDCAFETMMDSISTRSCFYETYEGTPEYWRKVWMGETENVAYTKFNGGLTRMQWAEGWNKLKESGTYEYSLGDLVLPGIAHCTKKDVLIFNTSSNAHAPVYVVEASTFGGTANTEIPVCLAYNQTHYESLVPNTQEDIHNTIKLKNRVLNGEYNLRNQDIPALNGQNEQRESLSYASIAKRQKKNMSEKLDLSKANVTEKTTCKEVSSKSPEKRKKIEKQTKNEADRKREAALDKQALIKANITEKMECKEVSSISLD